MTCAAVGVEVAVVAAVVVVAVAENKFIFVHLFISLGDVVYSTRFTFFSSMTL